MATSYEGILQSVQSFSRSDQVRLLSEFAAYCMGSRTPAHASSNSRGLDTGMRHRRCVHLVDDHCLPRPQKSVGTVI